MTTAVKKKLCFRANGVIQRIYDARNEGEKFLFFFFFLLFGNISNHACRFEDLFALEIHIYILFGFLFFYFKLIWFKDRIFSFKSRRGNSNEWTKNFFIYPSAKAAHGNEEKKKITTTHLLHLNVRYKNEVSFRVSRFT